MALVLVLMFAPVDRLDSNPRSQDKAEGLAWVAWSLDSYVMSIAGETYDDEETRRRNRALFLLILSSAAVLRLLHIDQPFETS